MAVETQTQESGIDPKIAKLLGLDFTADLDREDYISLLKEKMMAGRMSGTEMSSEDTEAITDEFKKVKKDKQTKFNVKKTTIKPDAFFDKKKPDAFFDKKKPEDQAQTAPGQKALPGSASVKGGAIVKPSDIKPPEKEGEKDTKLLPGGNILKEILGGVNSILGTLQKQNKSKKKQSEKDRKSAEKKKRGAQEDKLEKGPLKKFAGGAKKLLKPVSNFFADILKFIGTVLIGRLLVKIIEWMGDPENEKKMDAIQDFFMATWPAFLAVFLAFSLGLGGFITSIIGLVGGFALKIAKLIPMMLKGLTTLAMGNPIATAVVAGTALAAVGAIAPMVAPQTVEDDADKQANKAVDEKGTKKAAADIRQQNADRGFFGKMGDLFTGAGQEREEQAQRIEGKPEKKYGLFGEIKPEEMKDGGQVPGSGPNKDTVPAMLAPGEFVMSRGAVNKYGADTMESMNAMGGGTNRPMIKDGVTHAQGGGFAGSKNRPGARPSDEDKERPKSSSDDGGFLGGIKKMFGFGGDNNKDKGDNMDKKSEEQLSAEKANAKLLSFISSGEGGYNSMNQGTRGNSIIGSTHNASSILGKNLPQMTVGEVMQNQASGKLFAAGRYQIIPDTMKMAVASAGVSSDDMFDQKTQDKLGLALIYNGQRSTLSGYLRGENDNVQGAMLDLAKEWASAPDPSTGRSYYGGANASSHTVEEVRTALTSAREQGAGKFMSAAPASSASLKGSGASSSSSSGSSSSSSGGSGNAPKYKKINTGPSLLDLYNEQEKFAGRPEGFKPGGLKFKKPPSSTSDLENNSRSTTNMQQKGAEGAGGAGNQSDASPNPAATNVASSNSLPTIDANAMISQEKIKVLGITVV